MKQKQFAPLTVAEQALVIFAAERGYLEDVELSKILPFESALLEFARQKYGDLLNSLEQKPDYNDDIVKSFGDLISEFKSTQTY